MNVTMAKLSDLLRQKWVLRGARTVFVVKQTEEEMFAHTLIGIQMYGRIQDKDSIIIS